MASPSAILRAAKAVPGAAAATPPPQGVPGWMGQLSPVARELAAADGYANAYGPFLPRPPQDFTSGAFGPFSPILPVPVDAPEDSGRAEPRREQYETGWNLPTGVPGSEGIGKLASFATLRSIADLYSVARACIQLRKNEIRGIEWDIVPTTDAAKAMRNSPKQMRDFGERRGKAVAFFRRPDPDYFSWASFIDDALEQMFVFDALSLYVAPKRGKGLGKGLLGSDLDSLQLIDGQTVRPLYNLHGATPRPPAVAYQQYLYGVPRSDFSAVLSGRDIEEAGMTGAEAGAWRGDQLLYLPFVRRRWSPYGFTAVERALVPIMSGLQKQGWQLDYFRQGTVPACYISPGDVTMTPNQIRELQDSLNAITGDPAWHHKIIVLPPGSKTMPQRDVALADAFDEIVRVDTCMGFDVEPMELGIAPKVSTTMSPGAANQMAKMAQSKVDRKSTGPILRYLASVCDYILRDVCHQDDMRFLFDGLEEEDDEATETTLIVSQVGSALRSVDEGREKLGLQPWGLPETSDPIIVTPTGPVSLQAAMALNAAPPQAALPPAGGAPGRPVPPRPGQPAAQGAPSRPAPAGQKPPAGPQQGGQKPESSQGESPAHVAAEAAHDSQSENQGANPTGKAAARELDALVAHLRWGGEVSAFKSAVLPAVTLAMITEDLSKGLSVDEAVGGARALVLGKADYEWVAKDDSGPNWPGWDLDEVLAQIYAGRIASAFKVAARQIRQAAARALGSGGGSAKAAVKAAVKAMQQAVENALGGILQDALTEGYALGQQAAIAMITETDAVDWGTWVPGDVDAAAKVADADGLSDLLSDYGISAIKSIAGGNMDEVAGMLSDALSGGLSSSTLGRQIVGLLLSPSRAQMIAQTEIARAVSNATLDRFNAMGVTAKEWLVAPARACPICLKNAAQGAIAVDANFQSGTASPPAHPNCVIGSTRVAAPGLVVPADVADGSARLVVAAAADAAPASTAAEARRDFGRGNLRAVSDREYVGQVVTVRTALGHELTATPNHPVATRGGWVPIAELKVGDHVLSSTSAEWVVPAVDPDEDHVPPRIEDVAETFPVLLGSVPLSAEDFHGDGAGSEVCVIRADRLLVDDDAPGGAEHLCERHLGGRDVPVGGALPFDVQRSLSELLGRAMRASGGVMGGGSEPRALAGVGVGHAEVHGVAPAAGGHPRAQQSTSDAVPVDAERLGESLLALPGQVALDHRGIVDLDAVAPEAGTAGRPTGDSSRDELLADAVIADSESFCDLLARSAADIAADQVVDVRRREFTGHVYNLDTVEGWYIGNGIITHNCRCALTPAAVAGVDLTGFGKSARLADRSVRVIDLNGQETRRDRRQDDVGGYAAGGGATGVKPHLGDGTQIDIPGGVPGSQAGGEPPRWDGSEPEPRVLAAPDDEDDADYPDARGVPSRPGTYWPAPYMDGYWPQGGIGSQQAGTSSPGGHGPRGRPPNGVGKGATPGLKGVRVDAAAVYARMLKDFPPQAIAWVREASWVLADVPQDLIDDDDASSWSASRDPARVARFAQEYRESPGAVKPAVMVAEPGATRVKVIDGHHHTLAARQDGLPVRAYVGYVSERGGPWDETHSSQLPKGGGKVKAAVPGLTSGSGMISLDLPPGTVRPVPGGVDDHHVTIVYLGPDVDDQALAEACARAEAAARLVPGPLVGILAGVDSFPPSTGSDGKVPVFIPARIPLAERLREALADLSASEHADWKPHVTLAYVDAGDPLPDPGPPVPVTFTHLSVHRGDDVRQFPLGG